MELEELKRKAKNKEIKLEDLDVEDILKFSTDSFPQTALKEYFDLSDSEIKRIRNLKGPNNIDFENFIRDIIVLYDFVNTKYPFFNFYFINTIIITLASTFGAHRPRKEYYIRKIKEIDWENMNPKQEIIDRKIDVEFRKENKKELILILEDAILKYQEKNLTFNNKSYNSIYEEEYNPKPKTKKAKGEYNGKRSNRDNNVKERAIEKAHYLCEIDNNHKTFISKSTGKQYMEGHHLIPLEFEYLFPYSLDVEANVVSLCSVCHDEIHHGANYRKLINKLYEERKDALKKCGIEISDITYLYDMYDRTEIKELV